MFEGGNPDSVDIKVLTKGEFLVFCQLKEDSCAFIIHVPELSRYTSSAKESVAELAYLTAVGVLDSAQKSRVQKLAIATRGTLLFDWILIGDYRMQEENPLSSAQPAKHEGTLAQSLHPFFAPQQSESEAAMK